MITNYSVQLDSAVLLHFALKLWRRGRKVYHWRRSWRSIHPIPISFKFYSRSSFIEPDVPDMGTIILFIGINGSEMPGLISDLADDSITVDLNHLFVGKVVWCDIETLAIDQQLEATDAYTAG